MTGSPAHNLLAMTLEVMSHVQYSRIVSLDPGASGPHISRRNPLHLRQRLSVSKTPAEITLPCGTNGRLDSVAAHFRAPSLENILLINPLIGIVILLP